jgi:aryl-alcohol dehydrogenase-like predicted oxidoreductase
MVDEDELKRIMRRAYDAGINFVDTSNKYHGRKLNPPPEYSGNSEVLLGKLLKDYDRESWVVATKVRAPMADWPNGEGLSRKHIMWQIRESLRRLQLTYIDLYQLHWPDSFTPKREILKTLNNLIDQGLVRYMGESNHSASDTVEFMELADRLGLEGFVSLQELYNLLERRVEGDLFGIASRYGLTALVYSPLAQGVLSGKYLKGVEGGTRASFMKGFKEKYLSPETGTAITALAQLAAEKGVALSQLALAWVLHKGPEFGIGLIPIVGVTSLGQLEENLGALDVTLTKDDMRIIEEKASTAKIVPD